MKATLPVAAVCFAGMFTLSAATADAALGLARAPWLSAVVLGQTSVGTDEQDPAVLLKAAREAMDKGQLVEADVYLRRAESNWGLLHLNPLADSPKKVRRDLEKLKAGGPPARPSQQAQPSLLSSLGAGRRDEAKDPFQGQGADVDAVIADKKPQAAVYVRKGREALTQGNLPGASYFARLAAEQGATFGAEEDSPARLADEIRRRGGIVNVTAPPVGSFTPTEPGEELRPRSAVAASPGARPGTLDHNGSDEIYALPARPEAPAGVPSDDLRVSGPAGNGAGQAAVAGRTAGRPGDAMLLEARRALSGGDTRRALDLAAQARALGDNYGPLDDSPTKIEALVRRYNEVRQQRSAHADTEAANRMYALLLMEQAEGLILWRDYATAERLASDAQQLRVEFAPFENNPTSLLQRIATLQRSRGRHGAAAGQRPETAEVQQAVYDERRSPAAEKPAGNVAPAVFDPLHDHSRNRLAADEDERPGAPPVVQAADTSPLHPQQAAAAPTATGRREPEALPAPASPSRPAGAATAAGSAVEWVRLGDEAWARKDQKGAMELYRRAAAHREQLDPATAQHVQQRLQIAEATAVKAANNGRLLEEVSDEQQRLKRQVAADVSRETHKALDQRERDPRGVVNQLKKTRAMVEESRLSPEDKKVLLSRIDRELTATQHYIEQHRSEIELTEQNRTVKTDVDQKRVKKVQVQQRLALLVDEYNRLRDERRFAEAVVTAKQAREIAPDEAVVVQMWREIHFIKAVTNNRDLKDEQESKFVDSMFDVQKAATAFGDETNPMRFLDKPSWDALRDRRLKYGKDAERKRTPKEIEIEQKLRMPVSLSFRETPLSDVIDNLKRVTAVNIYVDPQGLAQEGVHPSTPVTIELNQDISLQSALNLILQPLHLGYVVKDEVLKITSEQVHSGNLYTKVYNVADLVIPIPDFSPTSKMGLPTALQDAYNLATASMAGGGGGGFQPPVMNVASHNVSPNGGLNPQNVLAQQTNGGGVTSGGLRGGSSSADFDGLIDLITKTIDPSSWDEVGGPGSVKQSAGNLSLVISQTQEVHEKIADLLDQLRRLQDLQVTIEVRFITLSDNFFERIGVDFDFNIRDNATAATVAQANTGVKMKPSVTIGLNPPLPGFNPNFVTNGAIQFQNNVLNASTPPFGGFDPANAATFGIAILSDIEAFFLVQAAEGDVRSNIMQAPKVTLFNGQAASISDQSQTPFVTSVTPIVGNFAAAQAPIIVVLNAGTTLSVQAVVSPDRRFVRLTLIPFFSQIGDVKEFQFTGTTTTNTSSADSSADMGDTTSNSDSNVVTKDGTTVQLPTFIFTTVTTTVSVPDGGTVLLGGVKRLKEGRNELGVPIMSKIPYINRLFKNVGIGREAQSLMLMVTPRIIIQEEEEDRLGLTSAAQ